MPSNAIRRQRPAPTRRHSSFAWPALAALGMCAALAGCHKEPVPQHPSGADPVVNRSMDSVAAPVASLPPPDAAMAPAAPSPKPTTTDANGGPTQASQSGMTKEQESSAMPLAGQANNHSTPAPTSPSAAADTPSR